MLGMAISAKTIQTAPQQKCAPRIYFWNTKSITERTRNTTTSTTIKTRIPIAPKLHFKSPPQLN
ncbi:hypothetical protein GIB67_015268, partial [Kingdonia uniflora]